ncbi:MAG: hypothetical protein GY803_26725 [Chloroflexi bacterium]|nr:hypothetical protein [Chloroflexota bacterium]
MATQTQEPKRKGSKKKEQPEIVVEAAGSRHLASFYWSKLVSAVTAPFGRAFWRIKSTAERIWARVEPYKWRIVLTVAALVFLTLVIGGLVSLWLWRDEIAGIARTVWNKVSENWLTTASEAVVAQAPVVSPNGDELVKKTVKTVARKVAKDGAVSKA